MATKTEDSGWCSAEAESFRARMRAQCEEIEAYRQRVMHTESRILSPDQAAQEWISRYAGSFSLRWP